MPFYSWKNTFLINILNSFKKNKKLFSQNWSTWVKKPGQAKSWSWFELATCGLSQRQLNKTWGLNIIIFNWSLIYFPLSGDWSNYDLPKLIRSQMRIGRVGKVHRCTERGRVNIGPPPSPHANFKRLVNKNAIKPWIGDSPAKFFLQALTP